MPPTRPPPTTQAPVLHLGWVRERNGVSPPNAWGRMLSCWNCAATVDPGHPAQNTSGERAGAGNRREGQQQAVEDGAKHAHLGWPCGLSLSPDAWWESSMGSSPHLGLPLGHLALPHLSRVSQPHLCLVPGPGQAEAARGREEEWTPVPNLDG